MSLSMVKLLICGVIALACIVSMAIDSSNNSWAAPTLTLVIGYVVGNASITENKPIIELKEK